MDGASVSYFCCAESTGRLKKVKDEPRSRNRTGPYIDLAIPHLGIGITIPIEYYHPSRSADTPFIRMNTNWRGPLQDY